MMVFVIEPELLQRTSFAAYQNFIREPDVDRALYRWKRAKPVVKKEAEDVARAVLKAAMQEHFND